MSNDNEIQEWRRGVGYGLIVGVLLSIAAALVGMAMRGLP